VNGRYQADLIWRFQVADHQMSGMPSGLEVLKRALDLGVGSRSRSSARPVGTLLTEMQLMARDRTARIDRILDRLPERPVDLKRVLYLRYGPEEHRRSLVEVLPHIAGVASMTTIAKTAYEARAGKPPRPHSNDVLLWLEALCHRISIRKPVGDDKAILADIVDAADELLVSAEVAYVSWAQRSAA
jgi:hypothetical protein